MNEEFERKVRAAAVAGWWTVLIAAGLLVLSWLAYLVVIPAHPRSTNGGSHWQGHITVQISGVAWNYVPTETRT